ncbi:MAG: hypothetical protein ACI9SG_002998 [Maribacter sp.]|jgi:hypothetical protein
MSISQKLCNTEYEKILDLLKASSIMTWQHINMLGEYNFEVTGPKLSFDIQKVVGLKIRP